VADDLFAMAPKKVSVTVKFSKPGIQPPIYLAGSFSEWQPQEMQHTVVGENEYHYHKDLELEEGSEYQYKFRIGEGDWWTLDEGSQIGMSSRERRNSLHLPAVSAALRHLVKQSPTSLEYY
jgi:hypothetical protein